MPTTNGQAINVGDIVTWRKGGKDSNALGITNCEVLQISGLRAKPCACLRINLSGDEQQVWARLSDCYKE